MLKKKEKTSKDVDALRELVTLESEVVNVSSLKVEVNDESNSFPLLIDGKIYGPYQKIRISPYMVGDKHIFLPIMTFVPLV